SGILKELGTVSVKEFPCFLVLRRMLSCTSIIIYFITQYIHSNYKKMSLPFFKEYLVKTLLIWQKIEVYSFSLHTFYTKERILLMRLFLPSMTHLLMMAAAVIGGSVYLFLS